MADVSFENSVYGDGDGYMQSENDNLYTRSCIHMPTSFKALISIEQRKSESCIN